MKLVLLLLVLVGTIVARPQLDLPPLVDSPPLQIFVPDLQIIGAEPEPQPAAAVAEPSLPPSSPPPPPPSPPPQPQPQPKQAPVSSYQNEYNLRFNSVGDIVGYNYQFKTDDGFQKEENGEIRAIGDSGDGVAVQGEYSYTDLEGKHYNVVYTADENGFRPKLQN